MTSSLSLSGRLAIITGAGSGIGRALALTAARHGMTLALADIDGPAAADTLAMATDLGTTGLAERIDVRDADALHTFAGNAIARFGLPAAVFANAGVLKYGSTLRPDLAMWRASMDINILGVVNTIHAALGRMLDGDQPGRFVITGSMGSFVPAPELASYTAAKHALWALAECLRYELAGQDRIGVSLLAPPRVDTPILAESIARTRDARGDEAAAALLGTAMTPDAIAQEAFAGLLAGRFYIAPQIADVAPMIRKRIAELESS